jgi:multicomponent Na+:H+ antiporter subunit E
VSRFFHIVWLVVIWLALWSDLSWANVLSGVAVALVVASLYGTWQEGTPAVRPVKVLHLAVVFLLKLVEATVVVARTVVTPRGRIRSGIVAVPLGGCSDAVVTLIADLTSLTPGTLSVEVRRDPLVLYVHSLHVRDVESVRDDVHRMATLAIEAFGDADARAAIREARSTAYEGRS